MATLEYCSNLSGELESWSRKLHDISRKIDAAPSIDKYKLTTQIEGLHILITELDDRIKALRTDCANVDVGGMETAGVKQEENSARFNEAEGVAADYDFGG